MALKSKNILFISYYFPPMGTVGSLRNYHLCRSLSGIGHKLFVAMPMFTTMIHDWGLPKLDISRIKLKNIDYRLLLNRARDSDFKSENALSKKIFWRFKESFFINLLIGDGGLYYIFTGVIKLNSVVKKNNIEIIYTSYRPASDLFIGYMLKKLNKKLIWICDFRDIPVNRSAKNYTFRSLAEKIYDHLIKNADFVTTVSEGLIKYLPDKCSEKIVVTNGLNVSNDAIKDKADEQLYFTYTGSLYLGQNLKPFRVAIEELVNENYINSNDITVRYVGKDKEKFLIYFDGSILYDRVESNDAVSYGEARKLQANGDINILLTWKNDYNEGIVTGKLSDYLGVQKPILCISEGEDDQEILELFSECKLGLYHSTQSDNVTDIKDFIKKVKREGWTREEEKIQNIFSWEASAQKLDSLINSL